MYCLSAQLSSGCCPLRLWGQDPGLSPLTLSRVSGPTDSPLSELFEQKSFAFGHRVYLQTGICGQGDGEYRLAQTPIQCCPHLCHGSGEGWQVGERSRPMTGA